MTRFGWAEAAATPSIDEAAGPTFTPRCHAIYAFLREEQTYAPGAGLKDPTTGA